MTHRKWRWGGRPLLGQVAIPLPRGPRRIFGTFNRKATTAAALCHYGFELLQLFIFHPQLVLHLQLFGVHSPLLFTKHQQHICKKQSEDSPRWCVHISQHNKNLSLDVYNLFRLKSQSAFNKLFLFNSINVKVWLIPTQKSRYFNRLI